MRSSPRPLVRPALAAAALAALLLGGLIQSCTTDAVGIDACRKIEAARCEALRVCPADKPTYERDEQVDACILFYRDQCLHGIENTALKGEEEKLNDNADRCAAEIKAAAACVKAGMTGVDGCAGAPVSPSASEGESAKSLCDVITGNVERFQACSFVAKPAADGGVDGSGSTSASSSSGGGGASSSSSASSASSTSASGAGGASASSSASASSVSASSVSASSSSGAGGAGPADAGAD